VWLRQVGGGPGSRMREKEKKKSNNIVAYGGTWGWVVLGAFL